MSWGKPSNLKPVGHVPGARPEAKLPGAIPTSVSGSALNVPRKPTQSMSLPLSISMPVKASTPSSTSKDDLLEKVEIKKPAGVTRTAAGKVWEDPILADWNPNDFRLFVGNLGKEVTDAMLKEAFSPFPSLTNHRVVRDRRSSRPKGYGFVAFSDPDEYVRAMREMNGKYIGSKPVKLTKSSWKDRNIDEHKFRPY